MTDEQRQKVQNCISALGMVMEYLDTEEAECGSSYWRDKKDKNKGYFSGDIGFFWEGLVAMKAYLEKMLGDDLSEGK